MRIATLTGTLRFMEYHRLRILKLFLAPPVTVFLDKEASLNEIISRRRPRIRRYAKEQPRAVEMNIRHEQRHRAALGDFPGFVEIALCAVGASALLWSWRR
jgi:hypothetical protein